MRFTPHVASATLMATVISLSAVAMPAKAFTVTQNNDFDDLLALLLGDTTGLDNITGTVSGNPAAFGTFENDPFDLGSGVVLSTGIAEEIPGQNTVINLSTSFDGVLRVDGSPFDIATLEISFDADETVEQLFFQYVFGSEEFLEYVGNIYNDFFTLELNGVNMALLNNSLGEDDLVSINNLVLDLDEDPESSEYFFSSDYVNNPAGSDTVTKLDGYTEVLNFAGDLVTGNNTLKIQIADVSDTIVDSAVFLKAESIGTVDTEKVPEPAIVSTLLFLGLVGAGAKVKNTLLKA